MAALLEDEPPWRRRWRRLGRHVAWIRREGLRRVIEEKNVDPFTRMPDAVRRARWRREHPDAKQSTTPVFIVGLQRSGTNMLVRGLERSPEIEVHSENSRVAFRRYHLRPDSELVEIVHRSGQAFVLFKPLIDSHRIGALLDVIHDNRPGRALWAYRDYEARTLSAVSKFGDANRVLLGELAAGRGLDRWQAQGLTPERLDDLRSLDPDRLDPGSASALFWYLRNGLYFDLALDARSDIHLLSYERVVAAPLDELHAACAFLGPTWAPQFARHIDTRAEKRGHDLELDARVRERCDDLTERLAEQAATELAETARPSDGEPVHR